MTCGVFLALAVLLHTANCLPKYPSSVSNGYTSEYKSDPKCKYVDEVEYDEKCEPYKDRVCYTHHEEKCDEVVDKICRPFVYKGQTRKCFNVTETVCTLKEEVTYEVIDAIFTVQKCNRASEQVCDTLYSMEDVKKARTSCIKVPTLACSKEEKIVHDKTCRTIKKFDCDTAVLTGGKGLHGVYSYDGRTQHNKEAKPHEEPSVAPETEQSGYHQSVAVPAYGQYGSGGYGKEVECKQREETLCTTTPRHKTSETCKKREEKVCEEVHERKPHPYQNPHCRNEAKKVCHVEQKTQPKQIKKYRYTKVCNPLVKQICDFWDEHKLVPTCVPSVHHVCEHMPKEHCEYVPKEHCYKVPRKVRKEVCKDDYTYKPVEATTYTADSTYDPTYNSADSTFTGNDQ